MECIQSNKICPMNNLKCKECALMDCKNTLKMIEEEEEMYYNRQEQELREKVMKHHPQCINKSGKFCSFLVKEEKANGDIGVRCFYSPRWEKCILN